MYRTLCFCLCVLLIGCGKPYVPKEMSAEQLALKEEYSRFADDLRQAMGESGAYVQVAVVDRSTTFPDEDQEYSKVLVLQREQLDLDDYGFCLPGKEMSESDDDYLGGFFSDVMFWTDSDGQIIFDDYDQPPGTELVVEWFVPNVPGDKVSLHFGGNPCLVLDLGAE